MLGQLCSLHTGHTGHTSHRHMLVTLLGVTLTRMLAAGLVSADWAPLAVSSGLCWDLLTLVTTSSVHTAAGLVTTGLGRGDNH